MASPNLGLLVYISAVEVFSLFVALVLVVLAYRGYKRSKSRSLLLAAMGFGILGIASLVEGLLYDLGGFSLAEAQAFRSTLTAVGLIVLVYSVLRTSVLSQASGLGSANYAEPATAVAMPPTG